MDRQANRLLASILVIVVIVGVLETVDRLRTHDFRWKTIPPVDHTLAEEIPW